MRSNIFGQRVKNARILCLFILKKTGYELTAQIQHIDINEYRENQPWPRVKVPSASMSSNKSSYSVSKKRNSIGLRGGGGSSASGSGRVQHFKRQNRTTSSYMATTTTTCTKTLVSLKSCRSLSEIETLPPTGYFASTVVQSTYVNDDFVSDNEDETRIDRNSCCKER